MLNVLSTMCTLSDCSTCEHVVVVFTASQVLCASQSELCKKKKCLREGDGERGKCLTDKERQTVERVTERERLK